jgi:hypothetical protein
MQKAELDSTLEIAALEAVKRSNKTTRQYRKKYGIPYTTVYECLN